MELGCGVVLAVVLVDVAVDMHVHVHVHVYVVRTTTTQNHVRRGSVREQGLQHPLLTLSDGTYSPTVSP